MAECERMLVAIDLALWLNDSSAALQAVVGCYGLLAPLMFHQIPAEPVVQVRYNKPTELLIDSWLTVSWTQIKPIGVCLSTFDVDSPFSMLFNSFWKNVAYCL